MADRARAILGTANRSLHVSGYTRVYEVNMRKYWKFGALMAVIVGSLLWLATAGISGSQTYYNTVAELFQMGGSAQSHRVRVMGDVQTNSITRANGVVYFTLVAQDKTTVLKVAYEGRDPLPD